MVARLVTLSIVSHGQSRLVAPLLTELQPLIAGGAEVILTINIPEEESAIGGYLPRLGVQRNACPRGFGANHNTAFEQSSRPFFAVVNPDIRLQALDFNALLAPFADRRVGACAPMVIDSAGMVQDSARRFPTWSVLVRRALLRQRRPDYEAGSEPVPVDWLAGMFVVFRREAFAQVGGFDAKRFFMYYEDVDICRRLRLQGWDVLLQPATRVVHEAQRASHRDVRHLRWHLASAVRYLFDL